jgi:hypothetical protein
VKDSDSGPDDHVPKAPPEGDAEKPLSRPDPDPATRREALIGRTQDGKPLGAAIYLSHDQLEKSGVDLEQEKIQYSIENGGLRIR